VELHGSEPRTPRAREIWAQVDYSTGQGQRGGWEEQPDELIVMLYPGDKEWFEHILSAMIAAGDEALVAEPELEAVRLSVRVYRTDERRNNRGFRVTHIATRKTLKEVRRERRTDPQQPPV